MKNKAALNEDYESVIKPELKEEIDIVQMCAHDIRHTGSLEVTMQPEHTSIGKQVTFKFKPITRAGSDIPVEGLMGNEEVDDLEYVEMVIGECGPDGCQI